MEKNPKTKPKKLYFFTDLSTRATLSLMSSGDTLHCGVPPVRSCCCLTNSTCVFLVVLPYPGGLCGESLRDDSIPFCNQKQSTKGQDNAFMKVSIFQYYLFSCHWLYWSRRRISAHCSLCLG